ncbi:MAG TPA: response regulator [Chitinophagales bacterium]|nr:response regulator [Chitinophagales bacterium]
MSDTPLHILIADDDDGDRLLFSEALRGLPLATKLTALNGGEQLMEYLWNADKLPHLLFLDLNMPRKNGFECLREIKQHEKLSRMPVVIFSTSDDAQDIDRVYTGGAHLYLVKPTGFLDLIKNVSHVILMSLDPEFKPLPKDSFVIKTPSAL